MSNPQRNLEISVIAAAMKSRETMAAVIKDMNGYNLTDETLMWMWERAAATYRKGEMPRLASMEAQARGEAPAAQEVILETIIEVWRAEPSTTPKTDIETLKHYQRQSMLTHGMTRATKAVTRGDLDGAAEVLSRLANETAPSNGLEVVPLIDFDEWDQPEAITKGIPTGIRTYDEVTMGGATRGDLGVVFGVTNMGKSILATNFGYAGFKHGYRILHIDSENGDVEVRSRYLARTRRLPTRALARRRLSYSPEFREWAERQQERIHKFLRLLHISVEQSSMEEVKASIQQLFDSGWQADEIIFDSPDHTVAKDNDNQGYVAKKRYETLKGWADEFNCSIWAVTQAKPEAEGKIATNKHTAWGYDKARIADAVLTINPGLDDKGAPMSELKMDQTSRSLFVAKARKSRGRFIIPLTADFPTAYLAEQLPGEAPEDIDNEETA